MDKPEKEEVKSKKDALIERLKAKRPDLNIEDEDSVYGAIGEDYDQSENELNGYRENEQKLVEVFNNDPRSAGLFAAMVKDGESPLEYLVSNYGEDFKIALEDKEVLAKIVEAQNKYTSKVTANKKLEEESQANLSASIQALNDAQAEIGCDEECVRAAFEMFSNIVDDAIREKVSKDTWLMFIKGILHDKDVEQAQLEGEIKGKNEKINDLKSKKTVPQGLPPQLSGQGGGLPASKQELDFGGVLNKYGENYKSWDAELKKR